LVSFGIANIPYPLLLFSLSGEARGKQTGVKSGPGKQIRVIERNGHKGKENAKMT
jgi:hypothetical protein